MDGKDARCSLYHRLGKSEVGWKQNDEMELPYFS